MHKDNLTIDMFSINLKFIFFITYALANCSSDWLK